MGNFYLGSLVSWLDSLMSGGWGSLVYRFVLVVLFAFFLGLRVPYVFFLHIFVGIVVFWVFPIFVSLLFSRLSSVSMFLVSLVPSGTPLWIVPVIFFIELISFLIRSLVLVLRPIVNLAFGCLGSAAGYYSVLSVQGYGALIVFVLLFYESLVLIIHWYIVHQILLFSHSS
uniref:ATP synthase F0 subunit 6 n=1 Tax=Dicrocoelium chinensis TaxID=483157 RepID=A0A096XCB9_DICCN|nr:ATP synthase F0 subunit 6 [Dicrocoelium chinensis]AHG06500.1 ATP synthase F0 subunit 6 [Dicrocoelium chinensis]